MDWLSLVILILKTIPLLIEEYKRAAKDSRYKNEAERIDSIIAKIKKSQGRDKLDILRELEK